MPRFSANSPCRFALCLIAAAFTGCSMMESPKDNLQAELTKSAAGGLVTADQTAAYQVVFQPDQGRAEAVSRSLSEPVSVQQALEQTGAQKKFRRIEVEIVRQLPQGGVHKIPCEYDRSTRRINPEFDYALMPGDQLVVKEDPTTIVDDILKSAGGGLGKRFTTGGKHKSGAKYRIEG